LGLQGFVSLSWLVSLELDEIPSACVCASWRERGLGLRPAHYPFRYAVRFALERVVTLADVKLCLDVRGYLPARGSLRKGSWGQVLLKVERCEVSEYGLIPDSRLQYRKAAALRGLVQAPVFSRFLLPIRCGP
jgi:hypothetical protein